MTRGLLRFLFCVILLAPLLNGCGKSTYPKERVKESILHILKKEYNIPMAQVGITGKTIHLYLPVERLFTADLDDVKLRYIPFLGLEIKNPIIVGIAAVISAPQDGYWELLARIYRAPFLRRLKLGWVQVKNEKKKIEKIQDAIELHPEVQDEIGQMLFAVARVARSTDLQLDFYTAQITDVRSGHEFILQGYLQDMNRLQLMDISQKEYHNRMLKDTHVNNRALVHFPVRSFFLDLNQKTREEVQEKYFSRLSNDDWMRRFYFEDDKTKLKEVSQVTWEVEDMRSFISPAGGRALVYVKVETFPRQAKKGTLPEENEFLFETAIRGKTVQILRIIPFDLLSEMLSSIPEFNLDEKMLRENIKNWKSEFEPKELQLEDFIARQIMMRLYESVYQDERIGNTFTDLHFEIRFRETPKREFIFDVRPALKDTQALSSGKPLLEHEDMVYLVEKFVQLAATILHNYRFQKYDSLAIELQTEGERAIIRPEDLELFYRKKRKLPQILREDTLAPSALA